MRIARSTTLVNLRLWDRICLLAALGSITLLAWWYLIAMAADMPGMNAPPGLQAQAGALPMFMPMFLMWSIMMVGMMVPSAARTLLIYARVARQMDISPLLATLLFLAGYLIIWTAFSLLATLLQLWLSKQSLLSEMLVSNSAYLGASLLVVAGLYQFTSLKQACLKHCQSPLAFISQHFQKGYSGAIRMGLQHGLYCLGCCWALMGLLFVAGVMNLLWILAISLYVLIEKLLPSNRYIPLISGTLLLFSGGCLLIITG